MRSNHAFPFNGMSSGPPIPPQIKHFDNPQTGTQIKSIPGNHISPGQCLRALRRSVPQVLHNMSRPRDDQVKLVHRLPAISGADDVRATCSAKLSPALRGSNAPILHQIGIIGTAWAKQVAKIQRDLRMGEQHAYIRRVRPRSSAADPPSLRHRAGSIARPATRAVSSACLTRQLDSKLFDRAALGPWKSSGSG